MRRNRLPHELAHNQAFLMDTNVVPLADITTDGIIYDKRSTMTKQFDVSFEEEDLNKSIIEYNPGGNITVIRKYSTCNSRILQGAWLKRIITIFKQTDSGKMFPMVAISYKTSEISKGNTKVFRRPHGNAKKDDNPFVRTYPSVLEKAKQLAKGIVFGSVLSVQDQSVLDAKCHTSNRRIS